MTEMLSYDVDTPSCLPFETIMAMTYQEFSRVFELIETPIFQVSVEKPREKLSYSSCLSCLVLEEGPYSDLVDWLYYNRHLLEYLTLEDLCDLAPSYYAYEKRWYLVNKKDLTYNILTMPLSPPVLKRSSCITCEEMDEFVSYSNNWAGPFHVSPQKYLDSDLLKAYLLDCLDEVNHKIIY